jgi:hypothetical protein
MLGRALVVVAALAVPAAADIDNVKANKLFEEAVALRDKDPAKACALFEEALGFNPQAISTRLNVALCDQKAGRIASAYEKFKEIADRAAMQHLAEFQATAEDALARIVPDLPYVTITFAEPPVAETKVLIDDKLVAMDALAHRPIDPGERVIVVTAPGRIAYRTTLQVDKRASLKVEVPKLRTGSRKTLGIVVTASGGATLAAGVVIGFVARGRYNDAKAACTTTMGKTECPPDKASAIDSARTLGNVGTVVAVVGIAAAVTGGVLMWRARGRSEHTGIAYIAPAPGGFAVGGRF